jgi:hypothetical protein
MNQGESLARVSNARETYQALVAQGLSGDGAIRFINEVIGDSGTTLAGLEGYADEIVRPGRQPLATDMFSVNDAKVIKDLIGKAGTAGDVFQFVMAFRDIASDAPNEHRYEEFGGAAGSILGGAGGGLFLALAPVTFSNPITAALAAGAMVYLSSELGESVGSRVGSTYDTPK